MSDARAIEAVTQTLRNLIDIGIKEVEPSAVAVTQPLDRLADSSFEQLVNLFLYQAAVEPSLRNQPPDGLRAGETGEPSLPLVLHYLLTPYSTDGDDLLAHRMLGGALRILHEQPWLSGTDLAAIAPFSDVFRQRPRITICWQGLEEKDIYSLWSAFQSPYRLSAAFQVRVILIDGRQSATAPLPVLRRGAGDTGPIMQTGVAAMLAAATPPAGQPAALAGDSVVLRGSRLADRPVTVRLSHPLLDDPLELAPTGQVADDSLRFTLPADPAMLLAGLWSVAVLQQQPTDPPLPTNEVPLAIAPRIVSPMPLSVARAADGSATVRLDCSPELLPGQPVALLLGSRLIAAQSVAARTGSVEFRIPAAPEGTFVSRLRVGGVDSPVLDRSSAPLAFDPNQRVTVT